MKMITNKSQIIVQFFAIKYFAKMKFVFNKILSIIAMSKMDKVLRFIYMIKTQEREADKYNFKRKRIIII